MVHKFFSWLPQVSNGSLRRLPTWAVSGLAHGAGPLEGENKMGLDNYFVTASDNEIKKIAPVVHLCGGMFSGGYGQPRYLYQWSDAYGEEIQTENPAWVDMGTGWSFRGKVYDVFFGENMGVSLYSDIDPKEVKEIAEKLAAIVKEHPTEAWDWIDEKGIWMPDKEERELKYHGVSNQVLRDLATIFEAAAKHGYKLVAWN